MNSFFPTQYSQEDLQRHVAQRRSQTGARRSMTTAMHMAQGLNDSVDTGMVGGDSLDDIIMSNSKEFQRRRSLPQQYGEDMLDEDRDQPTTMLNFGSNNDTLNSFQFATQGDGDRSHSRHHSENDLDIAAGFVDMTANMDMDGAAGYSSSMQMPNPLSLDTSGSYHGMSMDMMGDMMAYQNMSGLSEDNTPMNIFAPNNFTNPFSTSTIEDYNVLMGNPETVEVSRSGQCNLGSSESQDHPMAVTPNTLKPNNSAISNPLTTSQGRGSYTSPTIPSAPLVKAPAEQYKLPKAAAGESNAIALPARPPIKHNFQNIYSSSGFDMLSALMRVATRKNPEIEIGAVDMSCAFVVCDVLQADCPIVYVSDIFERLTGYNKHEVLGRNCRFLQAPDGKVMAGVKRINVDDESVYYLKTRVKQQKEAQRSLINYRKGGQPFMNLLTMIPIPWDTEEIRYIVGFQVDLVEQPGSVAGKGAGGTYTVNYSQGLLPRYVWQPPDGSRSLVDTGQSISRDDVSTILTSFSNSSESEISKRIWDKVLLENTDDVVHVLSLKGLFMYLSPSCRTILEYDAAELVGTALSSVCHPSDIVPVTRELKDTSTGASVNVVFRIRRKRSGYTWFESHGSLCVEQGKGRKCIILVGRERPVYALGRQEIEAAGGIGENELWIKLSTSGMFLFVSSNIRVLLDRQPEDLIGTSIQALMRLESKVEFGRCLERARTGKIVVYQHEIMNKRGQVLQAQTTLYPGDASEGQKPTFLVGQTRLLKPSSRAVAPTPSGAGSRSIVSGCKEPIPGDTRLGQSSLSQKDSRGDTTPRSSTSTLGREHVLTQAGGAGLAIGSQDIALASEDNIFDELKTTRCTSWQFELRQMEKSNRLLAEELAVLLANKKKRKRRKGAGHLQHDCANCHTRSTPEWRRGPSGQRDLCNSCGLRWAKQNGRVSPRTSSRASGGDAGSKHSASPVHKPSSQKEATPQQTQTSLTTQRPTSDVSATNNVAHGPTESGQDSNTEKRTTAESQPVHAPSQGFKDGGPNSITKIEERDEPT